MMIIYLSVFILIIFLIVNSEGLTPWDVDKCRQMCFAEGETGPWFGGKDMPWKDPATTAASTFDVAGCMAQCNLDTWYS